MWSPTRLLFNWPLRHENSLASVSPHMHVGIWHRLTGKDFFHRDFLVFWLTGWLCYSTFLLKGAVSNNDGWSSELHSDISQVLVMADIARWRCAIRCIACMYSTRLSHYSCIVFLAALSSGTKPKYNPSQNMSKRFSFARSNKRNERSIFG